MDRPLSLKERNFLKTQYEKIENLYRLFLLTLFIVVIVSSIIILFRQTIPILWKIIILTSFLGISFIESLKLKKRVNQKIYALRWDLYENRMKIINSSYKKYRKYDIFSGTNLFLIVEKQKLLINKELWEALPEKGKATIEFFPNSKIVWKVFTTLI